MRQLFVVHGPVYGGGQGQFARLREPMAHRGWELLGAVPTGAPAADRLRAEGVDVVETPLHRLRRSPNPRLHLGLAATARREVRALRRIIREHDIDLVQAHGDTNPHAAIAAHLEGRAVVWQLYDTVTPPPARRLTMPAVTRVADVITTWGRELARAHPGAESLAERCIPVFPPVDGARFSVDPAARAAARAELGAAEEDVVVGTVGVRNPTKGHDLLLEAVRRVRETGPPLVARVLGAPSPAHAAYEQRVQQAARGLGPAAAIIDPGRRVPELLPGFDIFCLSSVPRSEGMPTVILEAMACGLPVVTTDVGAVRELVADGETAFVVEPERPELLAERLAALAADPELRARMGAAGRRRFEERFDLEVLADLHERAYALALEHRRARVSRRSRR